MSFRNFNPTFFSDLNLVKKGIEQTLQVDMGLTLLWTECLCISKNMVEPKEREHSSQAKPASTLCSVR